MAGDSVFLIDSGYLSFITKFLGNGVRLKYRLEDFVKNIARKEGLNCEEAYFYIAPPYQSPIPKSEENKRKADYDRFISKLKGIKDIKLILREGRCQKIRDDYSQKGVDTLITMDLLKLSQSNCIKNIFLLTSDTDFVPVIKEVRKDKNIILVYFTDKKRKSAFTLSNHLWNVCNKKIKIEMKDFY